MHGSPTHNGLLVVPDTFARRVDPDVLAQNLNKVLGLGRESGELKYGFPEPAITAHGLIRGRARVIEQMIMAEFLSMEDPIGLVFVTRYLKREEIAAVTQLNITAGPARNLTERTRGNRASLSTNTWTETLRTIGNSIEMSYSMFHLEQEARKNLTIMMEVQKRELVREFIYERYSKAMSHGTNIVSAMIRNSTSGVSFNEQNAVATRMQFLFDTTIFCAANKYPNFFNNIVACGKRALTYEGERSGIDIIGPAHFLNIFHTRPEEVYHQWTGGLSSDSPASSVRRDSTTAKSEAFIVAGGARYFTHKPMSNYSKGSADAYMDAGGLSDEAIVLLYYPVFDTTTPSTFSVCDFHDCAWREVTLTPNHHLFRVVKLHTSSMLLVPRIGPNDQEIAQGLIRFPECRPHNAAATGQFFIDNSVDIGSVVINPKQLIVIPSVYSEAVVSGGKVPRSLFHLTDNTHIQKLGAEFQSDISALDPSVTTTKEDCIRIVGAALANAVQGNSDGFVAIHSRSISNSDLFTLDGANAILGWASGASDEITAAGAKNLFEGVPTAFGPGGHMTGKKYHANGWMLHSLDHPANCRNLMGVQAMVSTDPTVVMDPTASF